MTFYLCRLVLLALGWKLWDVALHVIAVLFIGTVQTIWFQKSLFKMAKYRPKELEMSPLLTVWAILFNGVSLWFFYLGPLKLLWRGSLLPGEALLGGMTRLSKMQTYVHRIVWWLTLGRFHAVLLRPLLMNSESNRNEIEREAHMSWVPF